MLKIRGNICIIWKVIVTKLVCFIEYLSIIKSDRFDNSVGNLQKLRDNCGLCWKIIPEGELVNYTKSQKGNWARCVICCCINATSTWHKPLLRTSVRNQDLWA